MTVRRRKKPRRGPDKSALPFAVKPSPTKAERNAPRNLEVHRLRLLVLRRAAGRCEFRCPAGGEPTEAHHVFGGADRRALEGQYTMAGICEACHDRCNASPAEARELALVWANRMAALASADLRASVKEGRTAAALAAEADVLGFQAAAELLEARIALAAAQAVAPTGRRSA